jgi:excisionase family DNA binding protein
LPDKDEKPPETQARYLLCEEVAGLLRLSPKTVYNMVYEGRIPCIRLSNKCVRFDRVEIEKWLKSKTQRDLTLS